MTDSMAVLALMLLSALIIVFRKPLAALIRLVFPQLTEERRADLIKQVRKYAETAKTAVRNVRRDANEKFKKMQKTSEVTEDDLKLMERDLQTMTDDYIKKVDDVTAKKEKELTSI